MTPAGMEKFASEKSLWCKHVIAGDVIYVQPMFLVCEKSGTSADVIGAKLTLLCKGDKKGLKDMTTLCEQAEKNKWEDQAGDHTLSHITNGY
eukprot:4507194-Amphidinium_carterae.1